MKLNRKEALEILFQGGSIINTVNNGVYKYNELGLLEYKTKYGYVNISHGLADENIYEVYRKKKKIKLYQYVKDNGQLTFYFYTDDLEKYFDGKGLIPSIENGVKDFLFKSNIFIEIEV